MSRLCLMVPLSESDPCVSYISHSHNMKASLNKREDAKWAGKLEVRELNEAGLDLIKSAQDKLKKQGNFDQLVSELGIVRHGEILRCEGRLVNSDLEFDARRPFILPRKHHLTELIVQDCHERVHHSGVRATLAQLRSKYWVPKGRQEVKRVLSECVTCKKLKGKPYSSPPTAALPEFTVHGSYRQGLSLVPKKCHNKL